MLIGGQFVGESSLAIHAPFDNAVVGQVAEGGWLEADLALTAAKRAFEVWSQSESDDRKALLSRIAQRVRENRTELIETLTREVGKPIKWSEGEVMRLALTFDLAADLTKEHREPVDLAYDPRGQDFRAETRRYPIGVVLGIVPYNWPYNLAAHKVAPALAVGNTVVLKPSNQAPLSTLMLCRLIHEAGCPPGVVNAVVVPSEIAERMALDDRVAMVSFTGSPAVGWHLKEKLSRKKVTLELGGDATVIVDRSADLDWAVERIVWGKYGYAGQICISVQHVLCHKDIYPAFREKLIAAVRRCPFGDPSLPETVCGPLISSAAADKVTAWIEEALSAGATPLATGARQGNVIPPTLLENVPNTVNLGCQEVFGPVLTLRAYSRLDEAIASVNHGRYGIHAGVFTGEPSVVETCAQRLDQGGVVINDVPTVRFDVLPYGGVKDSGFGREGVPYTMEEMTEPKSVVSRIRG